MWISKRRLKEREDEAYMEGYHQGDEEISEFIENKDHFISQQEQIILRMMDVITRAAIWDSIPEDLREELRSYA